jgi:hypothetical protein
MPAEKKGAAKRKTMRKKIEAGEKRNAERGFGDYAREARDGATSFVKQHPFATVAGGLALGAIIAAMVPGPGRRLRKKATAKGSALAAMLTELGVAYGASLLDNLGDAARTGQGKLEDFGETLGDTARGLRRDAGQLTDSARESARELSREAGKKAGRSLRDLRARMSH